MNITQEYSPGLEGIIAGTTKISCIDSDLSTLIYRGINVHELAEQGCFEETVYLLLYGKLPNIKELKDFKTLISKNQQIPQAIYDTYCSLPKNVNLMDQIRTGISMLASFDIDNDKNDHDSNLRKAVRIAACTSILVANGYRIRSGKKPISPDPSLSIAGNFLYILNDGQKPDDFTEKVLDSSLTLYAEHGFNASTFACRVTVSTLSDIYSGIVTGIGTLKGSLHGGANEAAMKMLLEINSVEKAEQWIHEALIQKKKIMGFGHREYKKGDNRADHMSQLAKEIGQRNKETKWGDIADILEKVMIEEKGIFPNVDFPTSYAYYQLGIPIELYTPIFVAARVSGWSAHAIEQLDANRLIRPKSIYEGSKNKEFIPSYQRE